MKRNKGCTYGATCGDGAEFEDAFECGVIFSYENWVCGLEGVRRDDMEDYVHLVPWYVSSSEVSGVTLLRKWMYSSVWKEVIVSGEARLGLYWRKETIRRLAPYKTGLTKTCILSSMP